VVAAEGLRLGKPGYLPFLLVCAVLLFQFDRLLSFTQNHAVNILYWDQWDFFTPFFQHASPWRIFDWQHGPPRLGLGSVFAWLVAGATHWNTRSEALAIVGVLSVAAALAVYLKRVLFGSLAHTDVVLPLLLLSRSQHETLIGATNPSHGAFPLLLTTLFCLAWLQPNRLIRYGLVLSVNFLMIYTGFGWFMGLITPPLLAFDCYVAVRAKQKDVAGGVVALVIALLSLASFFVGYEFVTGAEGSRFPYGNPLAYPWYAGLMFANVFGLKANHLVISSVVGCALLACVVGALIHHLRLMSKGEEGARSVSRIVVILLGFSLLFAFGTAVGRVPLGMNTADSSRYYPYVTIGIVGLYFHLLTQRETAIIRKGAVTILLLGAMAAGLHLTRLDRDTINQLSIGKRDWRSCYLRTESIESCDRTTGFMVHPRPEATGLKEKLDYLKRNKLNLYSDDR
jgi:hypothetical protein